jgi:hypothetical protein
VTSNLHPEKKKIANWDQPALVNKQHSCGLNQQQIAKDAQGGAARQSTECNSSGAGTAQLRA